MGFRDRSHYQSRNGNRGWDQARILRLDRIQRDRHHRDDSAKALLNNGRRNQHTFANTNWRLSMAPYLLEGGVSFPPSQCDMQILLPGPHHPQESFDNVLVFESTDEGTLVDPPSTYLP